MISHKITKLISSSLLLFTVLCASTQATDILASSYSLAENTLTSPNNQALAFSLGSEIIASNAPDIKIKGLIRAAGLCAPSLIHYLHSNNLKDVKESLIWQAIFMGLIAACKTDTVKSCARKIGVTDINDSINLRNALRIRIASLVANCGVKVIKVLAN